MDSAMSIPQVDLRDAQAGNLMVKACENVGFFKLVNHRIQTEYVTKLEDEALHFFHSPLIEKEKSSHPKPFGYGNKHIGRNGDTGRVEFLLLTLNPDLVSDVLHSNLSPSLRQAIVEFTRALKELAITVLELLAGGLKMEKSDVFSKMLRHAKSDSCFRINHYPKQPQEEAREEMIGFGAHTDPQIISILRSNNAPGLQIAFMDGSWIPIPPDPDAFFINVGDSLQVMTNGRFHSVKHRVVSCSSSSRLSMIFFAGPSQDQKIAPICELVKDGEDNSYREFTWLEYKDAMYKTKLGDHRLGPFENFSSIPRPPPSPPVRTSTHSGTYGSQTNLSTITAALPLDAI